jgi:hypothetical protein
MDQSIAKGGLKLEGSASAYRRSGIREDRKLSASGIRKPRNPKFKWGISQLGAKGREQYEDKVYASNYMHMHR